MVCFRCDKPGHIIHFFLDCKPHAYMAENFATSPSPVADMKNLNWCLDLSATHHVTANTSLPDAHSYIGIEKIIVGNDNQLAKLILAI